MNILFFCFLLYMGTGFCFMMDLARKIDSGTHTHFIKGDIVMATIFLPFTLILFVIMIFVFSFQVAMRQLKTNRINNWWNSPIRIKK